MKCSGGSIVTGTSTRKSLWLSLEWSGVHRADSGIYRRESNEGSRGHCPQKLKQNIEILF